jgi:hypothetical protein
VIVDRRRWIALAWPLLVACAQTSGPPPEGSAAVPDAVVRADTGVGARAAPSIVPPPTVAADVDAAPAARSQRSIPKSRVRVLVPEARSGLVDFARALPEDALAWVGPLAGNGGRDVLVYVPPNPDPARDFQLVVHFHGTHSERVQAQQPGMAKKEWVGWDRVAQTVAAIDELQAKGEHNVVLVYPLSAGKRPEPGHIGWFNKEYDRMWMRSSPPEIDESFDALHDGVLAVLGREFGIDAAAVRPRAIAEGHSAGGIALRSVAASGTDRVGEYLFLDASFRGWADGCYRAAQAHAKSPSTAALVSVVITEGGIADPFGRSDPWCRTGPDDTAAWERHRGACQASGKRPRGATKSCAALEEDARQWPEQEPWCTAMADGFRGVDGVYLLRTKVPHGKQPRHFVGGLELPADRDRRAAR